MTDLFEHFERRLGETVPEEDRDCVSCIISDCVNTVLAYTRRKALPPELEGAVTELALSAYNKRGAEGESSRSEGGISRSFEDFPAAVKMQLDSFRLPPKAGVIYAADEG